MHNLSTKYNISYKEARQILDEVAAVGINTRTEEIDLCSAINRILASDITAPLDTPFFDCAAMDGYCVNSMQINKMIEIHGHAEIDITNKISAGHYVNPMKVKRGECWEITTGSAIPPHFDSVIQHEKIKLIDTENGKKIQIQEKIKPGVNIRIKGSESKQGMLLLSSGDLILPEHIMLLASQGLFRVQVIAQIKIAIITTGDELFNISDNPDVETSVKIFNSNRYYLESILSQQNCEIVYSKDCKDSPSDFMNHINSALANKADIIISSGAVSAGYHDFIPSVLDDLRANIHFHKIRMKPGKPVLFAQLKNGVPYFGLPGTPIAMATCLRFIFFEFFKKINNLRRDLKVKVKLMQANTKSHDLTNFMPARVYQNGKGEFVADTHYAGSEKKLRFNECNGWLLLNEGKTEFDIGDAVDFLPLNMNQVFLK